MRELVMETSLNTADDGSRKPTMWERSTTRRLLKWFFSWRSVRSLLVLGGSLVTLAALFYAVENWRGARAYKAVRQADEARGETHDYRKLIPPPVPEDQNFAMCPLLKPLLDVAPGSPLRWRDTNAYKRVQSISITQRSGRKGVSDPGFPSFAGTNLTDLAAWQTFYAGNTNYPQPPSPQTPAADILLALSKYDAEFAELEQGASRPYARFAVNYELDDPYAILLPHLAKIKELGMFLVLRATARLDAGQADLALRDVKLALRLAEALRDEPILISYLVRVATLTMVLQCEREGLARSAWNEAQLLELQNQLAKVDVLHGYKQALRFERAMQVRGLLYHLRKRSLYQFMDWAGGSRPTKPWESHLEALLPLGWVQQNIAIICEFIRVYGLETVDEASHRVQTARMPGVDATGGDDYRGGLEEAVRLLPTGPYTFLAKQMLPALGRCAQKTAFAQWGFDAGTLACALERYRLAHGKFPDRLEDLVPRYIEKIPQDILGGGPLKYQTSPDGGYRLISVGWNLRDDGGRVIFNKAKIPSPITTEGDWVWTSPVKTER